eukprot:TRINITY_DN61497_c0_g1_i1.p1 TRINITY_DN61497_c0_g1~~TRINITY_DN61497_c0_g1_i1.p1  ORF type:complete len:672 (+),score=109.66 TRINITY_DN61497_c0_g1_i1:70-2085(+)
MHKALPGYSINQLLSVDEDFEKDVCALLSDVCIGTGIQEEHRIQKPLDIKQPSAAQSSAADSCEKSSSLASMPDSASASQCHGKKPLDIMLLTPPVSPKTKPGEAPALSAAAQSELVQTHFDMLPASPSSTSKLEPCTKLNLIESVVGLQGLKAALEKQFRSNQKTLPESFRQGYIVDLNQHWISVHVIFDRSKARRSLSLIVFDTLEVNYQRFHDIGLLRSSVAELEEFNPALETDNLDVASLCKMLGIEYDILFLAPISDMRRLTFSEEDQIRSEKMASSSKSPTVYYDRHGNPFRRIIVQPILQAERDGSCKSRSLAVLGWLLKLDVEALAWYVDSSRGLFHVDVRTRAGQSKDSVENIDEDESIYGSLMSTGARDGFGRDTQMKTCHFDTLQYNRSVEKTRSMSLPETCLVGNETIDSFVHLDAEEARLRQARDEALTGIKRVLSSKSPPLDDALLMDGEGDNSQREVVHAGCNLKQWRAIKDHEARWRFLEDTCFWWHNLGFKKIPKKFRREDVILKHAPNAAAECPDSGYGFGSTEYLRKYRCGEYITDEADPLFHKPLENFLGFLCSKGEEQSVTVPFSVLPFPGCFVALCLEHHVRSTDDITLDLEGDPEQRCRQNVSDYTLPAGNSFLNDPISYNKLVADLEASPIAGDPAVTSMLVRPSRH